LVKVTSALQTNCLKLAYVWTQQRRNGEIADRNVPVVNKHNLIVLVCCEKNRLFKWFVWIRIGLRQVKDFKLLNCFGIKFGVKLFYRIQVLAEI